MITLLINYLRRSWLLGMIASAAAFGFCLVGCRVFAQVHQSSGAMTGSAFAQFMPKWVQSAFNVGPESMTQLNGFLSVCLQHPFLLVVLLSLPIALLTGWITGDVENRSIALVLSRPVGRVQVICAAALVVLAWCGLAVCSAWAGCTVGAHWTGLQASLSAERLPLAILNLGALVFAFSGIAALISAVLNVRGDSVGWCLTVVLIMYVWNFLAQVWYGGGGASNYSLFRFYQPTQIMLQGSFNGTHVLTLAIIGAAGFVLSAAAFRLRSFSV